jgi:hypothetical protein
LNYNRNYNGRRWYNRGRWEMNNDSSYTFARQDGQWLDGNNLNAAHELLTQSGTNTSNIVPINSHGSDAPR